MTSRRAGHPCRGGAGTIVLVVLGVIAVVGAALLWMRPSDGDGVSVSAADLAVASRGDFDVVIPMTGELDALRKIEVRNQLESRSILTEIVEEGSYAETGDVLFRLADKEIIDTIKDREDALSQAQLDLVSAEARLEIQLKKAATSEEDARLEVKLAELALKAWEEGDDVSRRQQLALDKETASINRDRLKEKFDEAQKLVEQEFISRDEYERDRIAMIEAESRLKQAILAEKVYEEYTREREREIRLSALRQAEAFLDQLVRENEIETNREQAEVRAKEDRVELREERLAEAQSQLEHCVVTAPSQGLVVYASSLDRDRRRDDDTLEVGREIRRNQTVIVLPDTSEMIANVKVNEALSGLIEPGQRAIVRSDALPDTFLEGEVLGVGVLAESGGWRDPNRRDYTVRVALKNTRGLGLKPSMRCKADIFVDRVENAIHVPVQSVFRNGPQAFVYVPDSGGYAQKAVELGRASETSIEIIAGLSEGDAVLLREPSAGEITSTLDPADTPAVARRRPPTANTPARVANAEPAADASTADADRTQRAERARPASAAAEQRAAAAPTSDDEEDSSGAGAPVASEPVEPAEPAASRTE